MTRLLAIGQCCLFLMLGLAMPASAITLLQVDTFEDGSTQGWTAGAVIHPAPPANVLTGGPAGSADNYLQITALGGGGPGSRLSALNRTQWAGDYSTATGGGITEITMQVRNFGPDELSLRLLLSDAAGGPPTNLAITDAEQVPAGSGWVSVEFSLASTDLIAVLGSVDGALSGATELRLFHNSNAAFPGPPIGIPPVNAVLGVDNICATTPGVSCQEPALAVPEPATVILLSVGLAGLAAIRIRARSRRCMPPR